MIIEISNPVFGKNLRFLRKRYRLSQTGLAGLVGLSCINLRCIEENRDSARLTPYTLYRLSDVLNVPMEDLTATDLEQTAEIPFIRK